MMVIAVRALLAMVLEDSTAGTIFLMFPHMRARRVLALWLTLAIAHAAFPARSQPPLSTVTPVQVD
jgi:hypothetical protein